MMTRMAFAALLSLTAVQALGSDDLTPFYKTPYASTVAGDRTGTSENGATASAASAVGVYKSPYAAVLSGPVPARASATGGTENHDAANDGADTSARACPCQHA